MLRKAFLALALVASMSTAALATVTISAGDHVMAANSTLSFYIQSVATEGEQFQGMDLYLVMQPGGPIFTTVDFTEAGTIWAGNNFGNGTFGDPLYEVPTRDPAYFTSTQTGAVPGTGNAAYITLDSTGVAPGIYSLDLSSDLFGPSGAFGTFSSDVILLNGTVVIGIPEPPSFVMGLFAAAGLGAVVIRRRARNA